MYGKIFEQIYDSSVCEDWQVMVVFQQLIILSDKEGVIDKTISAISRRTNIPIDIITKAVRVLEAPDSNSRSPEEDGRRIVRIDLHRDWGWRIVNKQFYSGMASIEDKRLKGTVRQKRFRNAGVTPSNATVTHSNAPVTVGDACNAIQIQDVDINIDKEREGADASHLPQGKAKAEKPIRMDCEGKRSRGSAGKKKRAPLHPNFEVTADMRAWAEAKGVEHVARETEKFENHFHANGDLKKDWNAAWRNWMLRSIEYSQRKPKGADPDDPFHNPHLNQMMSESGL